jgi:hypothetical protein
MSIFPTTILLATDGSEKQSWWCAITKGTRIVRCTSCDDHRRSETTHSEAMFRALLAEGTSDAQLALS